MYTLVRFFFFNLSSPISGKKFDFSSNMQFLGRMRSSLKVNVTIWTPTDLAGKTYKECWSLIQSIASGMQMKMNLKEPNFIIAGKSVDDRL